MDNPLKNFLIDKWYKAILVIGAVIFGVSLTMELQADNKQIQVLGIGLILVGLGEWINHPRQTRITPPNAYLPQGIVTGHPWRPKFLGVVLDLLGIAAVGYSLYKLYLL